MAWRYPYNSDNYAYNYGYPYNYAYGYGYPYANSYGYGDPFAIVTAPIAALTAPVTALTTPVVNACELYHASYIGNGCSCRVAGGHSRGTVSP